VNELSSFQEFVARHVRQDPERNVQCMLLWTEWVRYYVKETRNFPQQVMEKRFFEMVAETYDVPVAFEDRRGPVYMGLRFVA